MVEPSKLQADFIKGVYKDVKINTLKLSKFLVKKKKFVVIELKFYSGLNYTILVKTRAYH